MTSVGGTALSTDESGAWIAEQAWTSSALSQGTSGGVSVLQPRPAWQHGAGVSAQQDSTHRLSPDVAADADPATGVRIVVNGEEQQGGGTSQSAPIWAGLTVLMNQYLENNGGRALGEINPLLYRAAAATPAAFHDVTLGADALDSAGRGYDLVTGLGTPDVAVLVGALRKAQS
jgi:kumamolisin